MDEAADQERSEECNSDSSFQSVDGIVRRETKKPIKR